MSILFVGIGDAHLGVNKIDAQGNVVQGAPAHWEPNPNGGSIVVGQLNAETMEPVGNAEVFGDWDAAGYLSEILRKLNPQREVNIPDFKAIVKAAVADNDPDFLCSYCEKINCRDCIIREWKTTEEP